MLDFYPTLAELAGLGAPENVDGVSIVRLLKEPESPRDRPAYSVLRRGKIWGRAVYVEDFRYAEWGNDGSEGLELYDLKTDPKEFTNLAQDPSQVATRLRLKQLLDSIPTLRDSDPVERTGD
jgi:iduronate 2-sulfatase